MFGNIGNKIKSLSKVLTVLGAVISVIYGFAIMLAVTEDFIVVGVLVGFLVMILGSLLSWIGSFTLYGFGEMIVQLQCANNNSQKICDLLDKNESVSSDGISQYVEESSEL